MLKIHVEVLGILFRVKGITRVCLKSLTLTDTFLTACINKVVRKRNIFILRLVREIKSDD